MSTEKPTQADGAEQPEQDLPVEETETDSVESAEEAEPRKGKDELSERIADLQRVTAEYHNYRKRVERDKAQLSEQVTASVVTSLLPILDDIDRAREHGDLEGPFASVAEQLNNALVKLGLEVFGDKGDAFDPMVHEAVAHMHSAEVTEPSCIDVMRRGYRLGERLLRPAMVAVAEPESPPAPSDDLGVESEPDGAVEPADKAPGAESTDASATDSAATQSETAGVSLDSDEEDSAESSQSQESEESQDSTDDTKSDAAEEAPPSGEADNEKSTAKDGKK